MAACFCRASTRRQSPPSTATRHPALHAAKCDLWLGPRDGSGLHHRRDTRWLSRSASSAFPTRVPDHAFNALTGAGATVSAKENIGMAPVADERLDRIAQVVPAKKVTPACKDRRRSRERGPALRQSPPGRRPLLVLDGWSGARNPEDDRVTLGLELLLADREHVERRLERVPKQAKSGDPALRDEVAVLQRLASHLDAGETLATFSEPIPAALEPLTTKPLLAVVNGAEGIDLQLEAELAEPPPRRRPRSGRARPRSTRSFGRLFAALDLVSFFTAGDKETRAWTLRRGLTALDAAASIHTDIANGFIRAEVIRWNDLVECGSHAEAARRGLQRLEGKAYQVEDGDVLNIRFSPLVTADNDAWYIPASFPEDREQTQNGEGGSEATLAP